MINHFDYSSNRWREILTSRVPSDWTLVDIFLGRTIAIVVSVVSILVVLSVIITIGVLIWRQRYIQKKRRGERF